MLQKVFFIILIGAVAAAAQPVLNSSDVPGAPGTSITYRSTGGELIPVNVGSSGANQTWNFTSLEAWSTYAQYWVAPGNTPFSNEFPDANRCMMMESEENDYSYYNLTSSEYWTLGQAYDYGDSVEIYQYYNNNPKFYFPVEYLDEWAHSHTYDVSWAYLNFIDSTYSIIDAWGTLIDSSGTYQCLRLKEHRTITITFMGMPTSVNTFWSYVWVVQDYGAVVIISSDIDETNPNFTLGAFTRLIDIDLGIINPPPSLAAVDFELQPAYPNPFNLETRLSFNLPREGEVTLAVYDATGREVARLIQGSLTGGQYNLNWDASGLPSGAYFARLLNGNSAQTQKLILLK